MYQQHELTRGVVEKIPGVVVQEITKVLEENGSAAGHATRENLSSTLWALLSEAGVVPTAPTTTASPPQLSLLYHHWGGGIHVVPEDFDSPSIDVLGAWRLWLFGNVVHGYPPYKMISSKDLSTRDKQKTRSAWKCMMDLLCKSIEANTGSPIPSTLTEQQAAQLFELGVASLPWKEPTHDRRWSQLKISTALRLVREGLQAQNPHH